MCEALDTAFSATKDDDEKKKKPANSPDGNGAADNTTGDWSDWLS